MTVTASPCSPCRWEVQAANRAAELGIDGTDAIPGSKGGSGRAGEPGRLVGRGKYGWALCAAAWRHGNSPRPTHTHHNTHII